MLAFEYCELQHCCVEHLRRQFVYRVDSERLAEALDEACVEAEDRREAGPTAPPQGLFLGNGARSRSWTGTPARARVLAAVAPAGPAPTTTTGVLKFTGFVEDT